MFVHMFIDDGTLSEISDAVTEVGVLDHLTVKTAQETGLWGKPFPWLSHGSSPLDSRQVAVIRPSVCERFNFSILQ